MNPLTDDIDFDAPKVILHFSKTELYWYLIRVQLGKCYCCGRFEWEIGKRLQRHRIISGKSGGEYTAENTILVCPKCHRNIEGLDVDGIIEYWLCLDSSESGVVQ